MQSLGWRRGTGEQKRTQGRNQEGENLGQQIHNCQAHKVVLFFFSTWSSLLKAVTSVTSCVCTDIYM
jgi:hypothetical protein